MKIKKFGEINENISTLNDESIKDLETLKDNLNFISNYNLQIFEIIECIDILLNRDWDNIVELKEHLETNAFLNDKESFMLKLINNWCSNVEID